MRVQSLVQKSPRVNRHLFEAMLLEEEDVNVANPSANRLGLAISSSMASRHESAGKRNP